jgi:hypothetical protein
MGKAGLVPTSPCDFLKDKNSKSFKILFLKFIKKLFCVNVIFLQVHIIIRINHI